MVDGGKEAERQRLAEALRANLKRRKDAARPVAPPRVPEAKSACDDKRG